MMQSECSGVVQYWILLTAVTTIGKTGQHSKPDVQITGLTPV